MNLFSACSWSFPGSFTIFGRLEYGAYIEILAMRMSLHSKGTVCVSLLLTLSMGHACEDSLQGRALRSACRKGSRIENCQNDLYVHSASIGMSMWKGAKLSSRI